MPNLFPTTGVNEAEYIDNIVSDKVKYGSTVQFDFDKHEFILTPTGKQKTYTGSDAWGEWCIKALATERFHYLVYSDNYGEEIDTLIGKSYPHAVVESEIQRMVKDCLMVDARTANVTNFEFEWLMDGIIFSCMVTNTIGEAMTITRKVVR